MFCVIESSMELLDSRRKSVPSGQQSSSVLHGVERGRAGANLGARLWKSRTAELAAVVSAAGS